MYARLKLPLQSLMSLHLPTSIQHNQSPQHFGSPAAYLTLIVIACLESASVVSPPDIFSNDSFILLQLQGYPAARHRKGAAETVQNIDGCFLDANKAITRRVEDITPKPEDVMDLGKVLGILTAKGSSLQSTTHQTVPAGFLGGLESPSVDRLPGGECPLVAPPKAAPGEYLVRC